MASFLPITLAGENLGMRHRQLNYLVNSAYQQGVDFLSIQDLPEKSPVDRIFKIDLASKYKNVEYILVSLKDEDMLYVSRALKSTWLIEVKYKGIINPIYLEDVLYQEMTTTAVTKMKHFIALNLKDPQRSLEFYEYYVDRDFDTAIKFLRNCPTGFILSVVSNGNILEQLSPHRLKLLFEKCPDVAKVFYDNLKNTKLYEHYKQNEKKYRENVKILLKVNGNIFLDIAEKYYHCISLSPFSAEVTKYILKNYKERFQKKPELYTRRLLDIKALAKCLTQDEIKDLVLKLARAEKLFCGWFCYDNVAPLIESLNVKERTAFKKTVFVDKDVGTKIQEWPYKTPMSLNPTTKTSIFSDRQHGSFEYENLERSEFDLRCMKKKSGKHSMTETGIFSNRQHGSPECEYSEMSDRMSCSRRKTSVDKLIDRFRYISFEKTMSDLRKQMTVETTQHRQTMMLVLVSKSEGRPESLEQLLTLLTTRHENEPENLRATIIRSLVRSCSAWRLPENVWEMLLKFGRGVGLDGKPSTLVCKEGLHAVIIKNIICDCEIDPNIWKAYMQEFSTLTDYQLTAAEKRSIYTKLPKLLLTSANKSNSKEAVDRINKAIYVFEAYKRRVDLSPLNALDLIPAIAAAAKKDKNAESRLRTLFNARIARKELFKENFAINQNDASYLNALKHDPSVLITGESFQVLMKANELAHDRFLKTLSLYFNENNGLAQKYLLLLLKHAEEPNESPKSNLARSIAILSGEKIVDIMHKFDGAPKKSERRRFGAALRANAHLSRPLLDLKVFGPQYIGAKAIANRVLKCSTQDIYQNIETLMSWSRTQKLALIISMRIGKEPSLLATIGEKRPQFALKAILRHLKRKKLDQGTWDEIISLIVKLDKSGKLNNNLRKSLSNVDLVPENKKAKYYTTVFEVFRNVSRYSSMPMLCNVEHILPEIEKVFIENVSKQHLSEEFTIKKLKEKDSSYDLCIRLRMRVVVKYLLLCKSESDLDDMWKNVGEPFFNRFEEIWKNWQNKLDLLEYIDDLVSSLKYTKVFLNIEYGFCLPMFERIIDSLQKFLTMQEFSEIYIRLHLTMLYFKAVRQSIKNNPKIFKELPKNENQAAEIVGRVFGKYIAYEITELCMKYFDSIIHIYKNEVMHYLHDFERGDSRHIFVTNIVKGIMDSANNNSYLLAEHIFAEDAFHWPEGLYKDTLQILEESKNVVMQLFFHRTRTGRNFSW